MRFLKAECMKRCITKQDYRKVKKINGEKKRGQKGEDISSNVIKRRQKFLEATVLL